MERKLREELNSLSKQVFGTSSKWQKLVTKGAPQAFERDREVMVPSSEGFTKKVFTDKKLVIKHFSVEEIKKYMEDTLEAQKKTLKDVTATSDSSNDLVGTTLEYGSNKEVVVSQG